MIKNKKNAIWAKQNMFVAFGILREKVLASERRRSHGAFQIELSPVAERSLSVRAEAPFSERKHLPLVSWKGFNVFPPPLVYNTILYMPTLNCGVFPGLYFS